MFIEFCWNVVVTTLSMIDIGYITTSWRETLSAFLTLCERNPPVASRFPSQGTRNVKLCHFFHFILKKLVNKRLGFQCIWEVMLVWRHCTVDVSNDIYVCHRWPLQWRHMSVMAYQITGNLTICSKSYPVTSRHTTSHHISQHAPHPIPLHHTTSRHTSRHNTYHITSHIPLHRISHHCSGELVQW